MATGMLLISGVGLAQANLLQNGGFDEVTPNSTGNVFGLNLDSLVEGQWDVYNSLPYWFKGSNTLGIEIQYNTIVGAHSPKYYVELDSHGGQNTNSSIFQTVVLDAGKYDLSFMYHARTNGGDNDNGIQALLSGQGGSTVINSVSKKLSDMGKIVWEQINWTFTVASSGTYDIGFAAYGNPNSLGGFIDSVSLNTSPVPEPATMLLFGTGLAGLAGVTRRKKKD